MKYILEKFKIRDGFTALEMVVVLAIFTAISAQVLVSFTGLNEGVALYRSTQELALNIRKAQNMSIAVSQLPGFILNPPYTSPPAIGVFLSTLPSEAGSYFLFVDHNIHNYVYDAGASPTEKIPDSDTQLLGHVYIKSIQYLNAGSLVDVPAGRAFVVFDATEGTLHFTAGFGFDLQDYLEITLVTPSGRTKQLILRTSGQINIK